MKVTALSIPDILLIEPKVFRDDRGFFFESFNQEDFEKRANLAPIFVQENHSRSTKGVLRGLHYQLPPKSQDKLLRVVKGEILDVVVDIRKDSLTFGEWRGIYLSDSEIQQIYMPHGFAHGFCVISDFADLHYKVSKFYSEDDEAGIFWNDERIGIQWPVQNPIVSRRDANHPILDERITEKSESL